MRSRSPRGQRPRSRPIFVLSPVSSMKISLSGSSSGWASNQASLAARTSSRSCSLACPDFFCRQPVTVAEPPDRAVADPDPALVDEQRAQLLELVVRRSLDLGQQEGGMRLDPPRQPVAALAPRCRASALAPLPHPADGARRAHPEPGGRPATRHPRLDGRYHPP